MATATAIGDMGNSRAIEPLVETLADSHSHVRQDAAKALGKIDPEWSTSEAAKRVLPTFRVALKNQDSCARSAAAQALGMIRKPQIVEPPSPPR